MLKVADVNCYTSTVHAPLVQNLVRCYPWIFFPNNHTALISDQFAFPFFTGWSSWSCLASASTTMHRYHFMASFIEASLWCFRRHIPLAIALVLIHQDCKYVGEYRCKEQHSIVKICKLSSESAALSAYFFKASWKYPLSFYSICMYVPSAYWDSINPLHQLIMSSLSWLLDVKNLPGRALLSSAPTSSSSALSFWLLIAQSFSFLCGLQDVLFHQGVLPNTPYKYKYSKQKLLGCG